MLSMVCSVPVVSAVENGTISGATGTPENNNNSYSYENPASSKEIEQIRAKLGTYYGYLKMTYNITEENLKKMDKIYANGMKFLDNNSLSYSTSLPE